MGNKNEQMKLGEGKIFIDGREINVRNVTITVSRNKSKLARAWIKVKKIFKRK